MQQPEPDTRDWTVVIDGGCTECGFSPAFGCVDLPDRIRANAAGWQHVLLRPTVRARPAPAVWSPLEYGAHVRDVLDLYDYRLGLMLTLTDPIYPNWDQDRAALEGGYADADPAVLAGELAAAAGRVAHSFEGLDEGQWQRVGRRSDDKTFTVERFGRYFLHDIEHHLYDVGGTPLG